MTEVGYGFCKCGCGQETNLWSQSYTKKGVIKGQPRAYISRHFQALKKPKVMAVCHPEREVRAGGFCGSCYNKSLINRTSATRKEYLNSQKEKGRLRKLKADPKVWAAAKRDRALKFRYGIDAERHKQMLAEQNNQCAICEALGGKTRATGLYVDHNHTTGKVRDLLCPGCNIAVGIVEQGLVRVSVLAAYLSKHDAENPVWSALAKLGLTLCGQEAAVGFSVALTGPCKLDTLAHKREAKL